MTVYYKDEISDDDINKLTLLLNRDNNRYLQAYRDGKIFIDKYFNMRYNLYKLIDAIKNLNKTAYDFETSKLMRWEKLN